MQIDRGADKNQRKSISNGSFNGYRQIENRQAQKKEIGLIKQF